MTIELVDGHAGTSHIGSDDLAALNTALVGFKDCVMSYGTMFALSFSTANTATLGSGVGLVGGRRFWNDSSMTLTFDGGTASNNRIDLVVARYAKDSSGVETVSIVIIKGTPTTGTAVRPSSTANDLELWAVPFSGITVGTPERVFTLVNPVSEAQHEDEVLYSGAAKRSVALSEAIGNYSHLRITIQNAQGHKSTVTVPAETNTYPFTTQGTTGGTTWVVFGWLEVGTKTVSVAQQLNMPIEAFVPGTCTNNVDCRLTLVEGIF